MTNFPISERVDLHDDPSLSEDERLKTSFQHLKHAALSVGTKVYKASSSGRNTWESGVRNVANLMASENLDTSGQSTWLLWDNMIWRLLSTGQQPHPDSDHSPRLVKIWGNKTLKLAVR